MSDFATRRMTMVDTQIRPSDVTSYTVIEAMLNVPRELYLPAERRALAYSGDNIALAPDRVELDVRTLAKMLEASGPGPGDLVLVVGAGLGYSAALVARMADAVVALEEDEALASEAQRVLAEEGVDNAAVVMGSLAGGAAKHGPFDVILIAGGVEVIPDAIAAQVKEGGRIVALFIEGHLGTAQLGVRMADGGIVWRPIFHAAAPVLPGFGRARAFTF